MTSQTTARKRGTAAQAQENREYVRRLLKARQPQFAAALESAVQEFLRNHVTVCALSDQGPDDRGLCSGASLGVADITGEPPRPSKRWRPVWGTPRLRQRIRHPASPCLVKVGTS